MMRRRVLMVVRWMDLQQVRPRLRKGRRRWFPRPSNTGAGEDVLILTAELVARARGSRTGAIRVSVIIVVITNVSIIIIVVAVIVRQPRGGRARRRATTTTSTATDTTTANAVDLHHLAVDRSRRLGSTRRSRDAATDHHHQTISPPPPPHTLNNGSSLSCSLLHFCGMHQVYLPIALVSRFASNKFFTALCVDSPPWIRPSDGNVNDFKCNSQLRKPYVENTLMNSSLYFEHNIVGHKSC